MKRRPGIWVIHLILAMVMVLAVPVGSSRAGEPYRASRPSAGFPVKLAIIGPLSGPVESFGKAVRNGGLLAVQDAQAQGWDVQVVEADSQCNRDQAAQEANRIIFSEGVKYIVGDVCSGASIAIAEIAEANQVLQISPASTSPLLTKNQDGSNKQYVFRACFLDPFESEVMAAVARDLGAEKAAILYDSGNAYVTGLAASFKAFFERKGGTVPIYEAYTGATDDFSTILDEVAAADVDALFFPDYSGKANVIATQARAMGIQARFLGGDSWDAPELDLGVMEGAYFATQFWPGDPRQVVVDFVRVYSMAYGTQPDTLATLGYDATAILLEALAEAGVDDPSVAKDKMAVIAYEGMTGKIIFDGSGDPVKGAVIIQISGGQRAFVQFVAPVARPLAVNDGPVELGHATTLTGTVAIGSDVAHSWDFGDGLIGSGQVVTHTYATAGAYTVVMTASNTMNMVTTTTTVVVREARCYLPLVRR